MKKFFSILAIATVVLCSSFNSQAADSELNAVNAVKVFQDSTAQDSSQMAQDSMDAAAQNTGAMAQSSSDDENMSSGAEAETTTESTFHQELKRRFIEGGPVFMGIVLICLILGLAIAIERIIFLSLSTTNSKKLARRVEDALNSGGVDEAKEICRNTKGPVASIYYQGLDRTHEGVDAAEKAVVSYGGVQMGQLEKNVSWVSLFIALAPMLGFMGTVIGMIKAFDRIEAAGDMQPSLVAGGIKVALLTTVFGLIVAIILQVFYNYIIAKIDSIVNDMEDASIVLIDILVDYKHNNKHSNLK
jgi:biopolymer transport protein ExbB